MACSTIPTRAFIVATMRSIASPARSELLILTSNISQSPRPKSWAMPDALGIPGQSPAYGGTDFLIARDGRISALYLFFDKLP